MTVHDFSHYAHFNGYLYVYKTPNSPDYTLQIVGSELQDELTLDSEAPNAPVQLSWGLIWSALSKIADLNGDDRRSEKYEIRAILEKKNWKKTATRKNSNLDAVPPHSLL